MKWFNNPATLEELKKQYKALAFKYHPDRGGNVAYMQSINNEYDLLFERLKNVHANAEGETYTREDSTNESSEQFKTIINAIIHFQNVTIEICGSWVWISGDTYPHRDALKALGFKWSCKKSAWYYHEEPYRKKSRKSLTLDEIRSMYGTETVETIPMYQLA